MTTHSSILAWKIPWAEEPGRLPSVESQRVRRDWATEQPPPSHPCTPRQIRKAFCLLRSYCAADRGHSCQIPLCLKWKWRTHNFSPFRFHGFSASQSPTSQDSSLGNHRQIAFLLSLSLSFLPLPHISTVKRKLCLVWWYDAPFPSFFPICYSKHTFCIFKGSDFVTSETQNPENEVLCFETQRWYLPFTNSSLSLRQGRITG